MGGAFDYTRFPRLRTKSLYVFGRLIPIPDIRLKARFAKREVAPWRKSGVVAQFVTISVPTAGSVVSEEDQGATPKSSRLSFLQSNKQLGPFRWYSSRFQFPLSSTQIPTFSSLFKFDFHMPILKAYKAEKVSTETLAQKAVEVCREMLGIICDRTNRDGEDDCGGGLVHSDS